MHRCDSTHQKRRSVHARLDLFKDFDPMRRPRAWLTKSHETLLPFFFQVRFGLRQVNQEETGAIQMTKHRCLDDEVLAAYFDGLLTSAEEEQLHSQAIGCDSCQDELVALALIVRNADVAPSSFSVQAVTQRAIDLFERRRKRPTCSRSLFDLSKVRSHHWPCPSATCDGLRNNSRRW